MKKIIVFVSLILLSVLSYQYIQKTSNFPSLPYLPDPTLKNYNTSMTIEDNDLRVEIVNTVESRSRGLSGRSSLCEACGMLFDFGYKDHIPSFWMKDMLIPIDIIWIDDNTVVGIEKNVQPEPGVSESNLTTYSPTESIDFVLEVNAGYSEKNSISPGQHVELPPSNP